MRAVVIVNPIAGPGRTHALDRCAALARSTLAGHGYDVEVAVTKSPLDAQRLARDAIASGAGLVVAWGGDGTVNGVGSALARTSVPLGIVPAGSGNGLARDLGLPGDPARALIVAATGRERRIDAGELHGALFFNVAGIGLDARIAERLARPETRRGFIGYVMATVAEIRGYVPEEYAIRIDTPSNGTGEGEPQTIECRALFLALANSRQYGNGAMIAPLARLDDGAIDLVVVQVRPGWGVVRRLPAFFRGTLKEGSDLLMRRASELSIRARTPILFHVDGEPRTGPETVTLRVHPRALAVRVP